MLSGQQRNQWISKVRASFITSHKHATQKTKHFLWMHSINFLIQTLVFTRSPSPVTPLSSLFSVHGIECTGVSQNISHYFAKRFTHYVVTKWLKKKRNRKQERKIRWLSQGGLLRRSHFLQPPVGLIRSLSSIQYQVYCTVRREPALHCSLLWSRPSRKGRNKRLVWPKITSTYRGQRGRTAWSAFVNGNPRNTSAFVDLSYYRQL